MKKIFTVVSLLFASAYLFAGTLIYTPTLKAPENGTEYLMPLIKLDWNAVAGSVDLHYEVQLDTDANFSNPRTFSSEVTAFDLPLLMLNTTYHWRVRAIDGQDISAWSEAWTFYTISQFYNKTPPNNKKGVLPITTLKWQSAPSGSGLTDITGIDTFTIAIDTEEDFDSKDYMEITVMADTVINEDAQSSADIISPLLLFNTDYFWKVKATNEISETEWSEVSSFSTIDKTKISKPSDGSTVDPVTLLKWQSKSWDLFLVQLSEDPDFTTATNIVTEESKMDSDPLVFGQTYFWRVALMSDRDTSLWDSNDPKSFTIRSATELEYPENGAHNVSTTPTLGWEGISGPTKYLLQVSVEDETFTHPMEYHVDAENAGSTEEFTIVQAIDSAAMVYWRVKAYIGDDIESDWSEEWNFQIAATGIEEATTENLQVYPNPSNGEFTLTFDQAEGANVQLIISDMTGKTVYEESLNFSTNNTHSINANLMKGVYILQLHKGDKTYTDKITIR
ncbi:MAG: hypothetical protein CSA95_09095 [Bacteroidetes bacterium]|nr:MAG: hypothetical protein CSA95_09095 [Bacteroidota bacterium]PIE88455.1 MAG: hypothetical protein CSA04_01805 [Bacteroidota bacterium]